jgi:hypothetical protein
MEATMRKLIVTAATIAGISLPTAAGAQAVIAADTAGPDVVVTAPPAAVIVPQPYTSERVYIAPEAYAYYDAGPRYYQDCWWDWGRRVCRLKPWW